MSPVLLLYNSKASDLPLGVSGNLPALIARSTNFSVAIDRKFYRGTGENRTLVKETDWIPVVCWGTLASTCSTYLQKGSKVAVSGSVRPRTYTDSNGNTRSTFEIIASEIEFLDRIRNTAEGASPQA